MSNESFSSEQIERPQASDSFSPKRLRALQALSVAIFSEPPADPTARQENEELVVSSAELFFPGMPEEQARRYLARAVTILLDAAAEERGATRELTRQDDLIADITEHFGYSEEEARRRLELWAAPSGRLAHGTQTTILPKI